MKWTKVLPTEEGHYWLRRKTQNPIMTGYIFENRDGWNVVSHWKKGDFVDAYEWFYGPVEAPKFEKESE